MPRTALPKKDDIRLASDSTLQQQLDAASRKQRSRRIVLKVAGALVLAGGFMLAAEAMITLEGTAQTLGFLLAGAGAAGLGLYYEPAARRLSDALGRETKELETEKQRRLARKIYGGLQDTPKPSTTTTPAAAIATPKSAMAAAAAVKPMKTVRFGSGKTQKRALKA